MAIIKKKRDLAVGNIVGANTMNALWAFGFDAAVIRPLPFDNGNMFDVYAAFGLAVLLWLFMAVGGKYRLQRWNGIVFLLAFVGYVVFKYMTLPK
jgi:cation:H+ antiporter